MAIAQPIKADAQNVISVYDPLFDDQLGYQIRLTDQVFCNVVTVLDVNDVSFCRNKAKLFFNLPCIEPGSYKIEILNQADQSVLYTCSGLIS